MDSIQGLDDSIRAWTENHHSGAGDAVFATLSSPWTLLLVLPLVAFWIYRRRRAAIAVLLAIGATAALTDASTGLVIKPLLPRPRPDGHGQRSFPSSHAANVAGAATILAFEFPLAAPVFLGAAVAVGFSRVYLDRHYPSDVAAGLLLGAMFGSAAYLVLRRIRRRRATGVDAPSPAPIGSGDASSGSPRTDSGG